LNLINIILLLFTVTLVAAVLLVWLFGRLPHNNPKAFLKKGRAKTTKTLVICAGDSLTQGNTSANYVEMLRQRCGKGGYEFVNAGINGDLAYNLMKRLDYIIACQPDMVTILIGTNDVNATYNEEWYKRYKRGQKLPQRPSKSWYRHNLELIADRLSRETNARVVLLSMPMLGEDLGSGMNQRVRDYNSVVKETAEKKGVEYLPLHEKLIALLNENHHQPAEPYRGDINIMFRAIWHHYLKRKSWDQISAENGLHLMTDHIHLNSHGAAVIADLIAGILP